jgi:tRNA (guanine37-N1)-methyltransferase
MRSSCLIVPKERGEEVRRRLLKEGLLRTDLSIRQEEDSLCLPVTAPVDWGFPVKEGDFEEVAPGVGTYRDLVAVPNDLRRYLPTSFDVIGKVAILKVPDELEGYVEDIGKAILEACKGVRSVARDSGVRGEYRVRDLEVIAGEEDLETEYTEYGLTYLVDPSKAYFSPRLATERWRVAGAVGEGEVVLDLFSGVGPYAIMIAKHSPAKEVHAVDSNPEAVRYLEENIRRNKVSVEAHRMDAVEALATLPTSHRIIMDHPHGAKDCLQDAVDTIADGGTIHFYEILGRAAVDERVHQLEHLSAPTGPFVEVVETREVREYSPSMIHAAFDIRVFQG